MSLRNYIPEYTEISTNIIERAEAMVDEMSNPFTKVLESPLVGFSSTASATSLTLDGTSVTSLHYDNEIAGCILKLTDETGAVVQNIIIKSYTHATGVVTYDTIISSLDYTGVTYYIQQVAKYPRLADSNIINKNNVLTMVTNIPEAVKEAVIDQAKFIDNIGLASLDTMQTNIRTERVGSYSYELADTSLGTTFSKSSYDKLKNAGLAGSFAVVG